MMLIKIGNNMIEEFVRLSDHIYIYINLYQLLLRFFFLDRAKLSKMNSKVSKSINIELL
jgi:hypothetical protein